MISQTNSIGKASDAVKDMVDDYGGVASLAVRFDWSPSTIYKWLDGQKMSMTFAVCIAEDNPKFKASDFLGYDLVPEKAYMKIITYFGSQSKAAKALGVSQNTVFSWLRGDFKIKLDKAERLAELTHGLIQPSDFSHLASGESE